VTKRSAILFLFIMNVCIYTVKLTFKAIDNFILLILSEQAEAEHMILTLDSKIIVTSQIFMTNDLIKVILQYCIAGMVVEQF